MTTIKNVTEEKENKQTNSNAYLDFLVPIKSTTTTEGEKRKESRKKIQKNLQNKYKNKNNNAFLESLLSESFPMLGITVFLTSLGCPPTLH